MSGLELINRMTEENRNLLETIQALKTLISDQKEKIEVLESRARYKDEEIEELRKDVTFWKDGYRIMAALTEKYKNLIERSEEHTSELQSPKDLVCRLLLE